MNKIQLLVTQFISFLEKSEESIYSESSPSEIIKDLKFCIEGNKIDKKKLSFIILPTNALQDISIDNGWGDKFCELSSELGKLLK